MYRVELNGRLLHDCPSWWVNFVDPLNRAVTDEDLAPYKAIKPDYDSVIFETEEDFLAFVLKFGGIRCIE